MKISVVGFGSTNSILVQRPWMGTGLTTHSSGDVVTRIEGNYNIVDSTVHFVDAPYGKDPVSSDSNPPRKIGLELLQILNSKEELFKKWCSRVQ